MAADLQRHAVLTGNRRLLADRVVVHHLGIDLELPLAARRSGDAVFHRAADGACTAIPQRPLRFFAGRRFRQRDFAVGFAEADRAGGVLLRIEATRHVVVLVGGGVGHFVHPGVQFLFHFTGVARRAHFRQLGGDAAARIVAVAQTGIHIHLHAFLDVFAAFNV